MSDYPKYVYRKAQNAREDHSAFESLVVVNDDDLSQALLYGWHHDVISALTEEDKPAASDGDLSAVADDDLPPTRAELEAKAEQLGLKFDGRTSDRKLGIMISEALGE